MEPKWSSAYLCNVCNASKEVLEILEEGIYADTNTPYAKIKLRCGHTHKFMKVSRTFNIGQLFRNTKVSVKPLAEGGVPVVVSGSSQVSQIASFSGFQAW